MTMLLAKYIPHGMSEVNECSTPQCSYLEVVLETVKKQEKKRREEIKKKACQHHRKIVYFDFFYFFFLPISLTLF